MSAKVITVFGATGYQGTSVIDSLLQNKTSGFSVRGITRNPESDKAKALAARGVEIVKADGLVKEQLVEAFKGSWGAFANTNSDDPSVNEPGSPTESDLGKIIVDAAFDAGVKVFIYSGFESASKITNGAVPSKAFDEKAAVTEYAKAKGFTSAAAVSPGWYFENHLSEELAQAIGGFPFTPDDEGFLTLRVPNWGGNNEIPFIGIGDDYGDLVHGVFLSPEENNGRLIQGFSSAATADELVAEFQKVTGKKARFTPMENWQDFETYGMTALETVKYMFGFCQHADGKYYGTPNDVEPAKKLKASAVEAKGGSADEAKLMTPNAFFTRYFS